jgi:hypothetical protein
MNLPEFISLIDKAWGDPCPGNIQRLANVFKQTLSREQTGQLLNCPELAQFLAAHRAAMRYWQDAMYNPTRYAPS